jgi:dCMP deaminase
MGAKASIMTLQKRDSWDLRYMDLATHIAGWSKDPRKKVGAVVIGEYGQILAQGYNGFPRGMFDDPNLMTPETKLLYTVHAEANCIFNASLSGVSLAGATMYVSGFPPCSSCAGGIIQSGIKVVYCNSKDKKEMEQNDDWAESLKATERMFLSTGVRLRTI